eukprot:10566532-Alexandrium_andersonii.AAC.1
MDCSNGDRCGVINCVFRHPEGVSPPGQVRERVAKRVAEIRALSRRHREAPQRAAARERRAAEQALSATWPDDVPHPPQSPFLEPFIARPPVARALTEEQRAALSPVPPPAAGASASSVDEPGEAPSRSDPYMRGRP